jgi:galactose-1-phosphate uridylyltransferase
VIYYHLIGARIFRAQARRIIMKKVVITTVGIVCLALIGLAIAGPGLGRWHYTPEERVEYLKSEISEKLELTDAQIAALNRIGEEILAEHDQLKGTHEAFKANFVETLNKEVVTPEELKALFETKKPVINDLMQMAAEHIAEFHAILTPEQRATLIAEIESHQKGRCRFFH